LNVFASCLVGFALLVACFPAASASRTAAPAAYDITVRIDPASRELSGTSTIVVEPGRPVEIILARRFEVDSITIDGTPAPSPHAIGRLLVWVLGTAKTARRIDVRWRGMLAQLDASLDHRQTLGAAIPVTGAEGTFLPAAGAWYPQERGLLPNYRVTLDLPHGQRGLVPGRLVAETEADGRYRASYEFPYPSEGIDLMAGPYQVQTRNIRTAGGKAVSLRTYFHPQIAELASGYLDAVQGYIDLYEGGIGEYPFTEFSIVSSPTPTGFGMPTLTYLGIDVLRLPFIRTTSLGHEILHNWWGNGVYPDYARGNWSEGLTTFMADYAYKEREGDLAAREMRVEWLRDFAAVPPGQDRPLTEFTSRTHSTSQIVGYDKAAMMFLMLRDLIGRDAFDLGVKLFWRNYRFKTASWEALRMSFEAASKRDLLAFFWQWLARQGAPSVRIERAELSMQPAGHRVQFTLAQSEPAYQLRVPIAIRTEHGVEVRNFDLDRPSATFSLDLDARPVELALDPDFRLFRRLSSGETPPILRQVMLDPSTVTVLPNVPASARESAELLAAKLQDHLLHIRPDTERTTGVPLLVIGLDDQVDRWLASQQLPTRPEVLRGRGSAVVWMAALPQEKSMAVVSARNAEALAALLRPLPHYGRKSYVVFDGIKAVESGVWPSQPQVWRFR
jgi:aminopeptidase N